MKLLLMSSLMPADLAISALTLSPSHLLPVLLHYTCITRNSPFDLPMIKSADSSVTRLMEENKMYTTLTIINIQLAYVGFKCQLMFIVQCFNAFELKQSQKFKSQMFKDSQCFHLQFT